MKPFVFPPNEPNTDPFGTPTDLQLPPWEPLSLRHYSDVELDGGSEPWRLFNGDAPKLPRNDKRGEEAYVQADPNDPVGQKCSPGDANGYWYYNVSTPVIVPFIVAANDPKRSDAAVLVIPGGGMRFLAWEKEGTHVAKFLNSIGISAFVVKYRVSSETTQGSQESLVDIQRAISLVRSRADTFGLNSSRI